MLNDGSLDAAAAAIDEIPANEMTKPDRAADGTFKGKEPAAEAVESDKIGQTADKAVADKADEKAAETEAEAEEDYIELPPDGDGKEPTRLKLQEAIEGYRKAQTLEAEVAKLREQGPAPEAWDQEIIKTVTARQQHMAAIEQWARVNQPQPPDIALLDGNNPNYNPDAYFQQHRQFEALKKAHATAEAQWKDLSEKQTAEQEALSSVRLQREKAKLDKVWPELKEKAVSDKVRADLKSHYGLDDAVVNSVADSRFFALAKDALAYRSQKAAAQTAAKIVTAKPKLIPGKARITTNGKSTTYNNALGRLQQSGSVDDAASAIASLL